MSEPASKPQPMPYELHPSVMVAQAAFTAAQTEHQKAAKDHDDALEDGRDEVRKAPAHEHEEIRARHTPKITALREARKVKHAEEAKARAALEAALGEAHEVERKKSQRLFLK